MSSTSGTTSYRIDPLKGIKNYATWKIKIIDILDDMGLSEHIEGPLPTPSPAPQSASTSSGKLVSQSKSVDWDSKDRKALTAIRLRVADTMLVYVANVKTAGDAWRILRDLFESQGSMGLVLTRRKIYKAECAEG